MTTNIGFRTLLVVPGRRTQQRMPRLTRYESFEARTEGSLGCFRGLLWALIFEATVLAGAALCWLLTHHTFRA
jgi:hypothetical protein